MTDADVRLFDPGLQPERIELAWRRTALAIGVGSLLALRILPALAPTPEGEVLLLIPGIVGVLFAAVLWVRARARARRTIRALLDGRADQVPGAWLLLALTIFVLACGVASAAIIVLAIAG